MKTFEDELLAELRTVVAERSEPVRRSRPRRRAVLAFAACASLAGGAAVGVPLVGGEQAASPAYAVTNTGDGEVTVTIYLPEDADGLERRLAQAGVTADVEYYSSDQRCDRTPRGVGFAGYFSATDNWDGERSHGISYTLKPADFKDATLLIEAALPTNATTNMVRIYSFGFKKTGSYGPCILKPAIVPIPPVR